MNDVVMEVMPAGRLLRAYCVEAKYESLRMLRTIAFALPLLGLPLIVYLLFGVVMAHEAVAKDPAVANFLFVGFSVFAIMGPALFGVGCTLAMERDAGLMKLKRALPAPPGAYLLAKMLCALFMAALAMIMMITTALLAGQITLSAGQLVAITGVMILGSLPFCAIGLFIGAFFSGGAAPAIANLVFLPMIWLSGVFIPLPAFLRPWAVIWPAFHLDQVAVAAAGLDKFQFIDGGIALAVLVGITVLFGGLALVRLVRKG
jgi:ABC-2 type transport system permease protein